MHRFLLKFSWQVIQTESFLKRNNLTLHERKIQKLKYTFECKKLKKLKLQNDIGTGNETNYNADSYIKIKKYCMTLSDRRRMI